MRLNHLLKVSFSESLGRRLKKPAEKNLLSDGKNIRVLAYGESNVNINKNFFPHLFLVPQEPDLPFPGGTHYGFACICFPLLGLELRFLGVDKKIN